MSRWGNALLGPIVVVALWAVPGDEPVRTSASSPEAATSVASSTTVDRGSTSSVAAVVESASSHARDMRAPSSTTASPTSILEPSTTTAATTTARTDPTASTVPPIAMSSVDELSMGDQALLRISYPWRERFPEWTVTFRGPRTGLRALTYPSDKHIDIFVRSSDTVESLHRVFAHELGHVIDVELNSQDDRDRWRAQRDTAESVPWWPSEAAPDFATGAGDFAEAFAVWETGIVTRSTVAGQPTADDLAVLAELSS